MTDSIVQVIENPVTVQVIVGQVMASGAGGGGDGISALTGDVTASGSGSVAATIAAKAVTLTKMADVATDSLLGRGTAGEGTPEVLTPSQVKAILALAAVATSGSASDLGSGILPAARLAEPRLGPTRFFIFDDMETLSVPTGGGWVYSSSGSGSSQSAIVPIDEVSVGWVKLAIGTNITSRSSRVIGSQSINFAAGQAKYRGRGQLGVLSDGTNTIVTRIGFIDSSFAESANGAFFRYVHSANGGLWQAVTRANGVETWADTGITAAALITSVFEVEVDASIPQAVFKIDGAVVATITTNIPSGAAQSTGAGFYVQRTLGAVLVPTALQWDYQSVEQVLAGRT